jgi:hypothetical protein
MPRHYVEFQRLIRVVVGLAAIAAAAALPARSVVAQAEAQVPDFSGAWDSTYGLLEIDQNGANVTGHYSYGGGSTIDGTVSGPRLTFHYREPTASGDGWFELGADGQSLAGQWHETGSSEWYPWTATRSERVSTLEAESTGWSGLFETTYGRLRLARDGDQVTGTYSWGGGSSLTGHLEGSRLVFRYQEPTVAGDGWFELSDDGTSLNGSWRADGGSDWASWTGTRVVPEPGVVWLVVLEAPWETSLAENEYAFGDMLRAYFQRMPNVRVRHRRLYDVDDFRREAADLAYLAEPVAVLIASHGEGGQLTLEGGALGAEPLTQMLINAPNVFLLHFSSCEMMTNGLPEAIRAGLPPGRRVALSGYATAVDWSASALIEFLYLDLVLGRGFSPRAAADVVLHEMPFAGDSDTPDSPLGPARFRFVE